jgi:hypothetical protein
MPVPLRDRVIAVRNPYLVMEEIGVSVRGQAAKGIKEFLGKGTFLSHD